MPRLLVDVPAYESGLARLRALPAIEVELVDPPEERCRPLPPAQIRDVDVLLCTYPPENFAGMRRLDWLQVTSAGYSQLFGLPLNARGIRAANGRGCFDAPIGEWVAAMMVNLARDLRGMIRNQDACVWDRDARYQREIRGLTVGLWGYGGIGRETARLAKAMGMRVHVHSRKPVGPAGDIYRVPGTGDPEGKLPDRVFSGAERLEFLASLDFLVLAMPLTPVTEGIVGAEELRAMRPDAFLLNPARGPLVQEQALIRALTEGWIRGAALDTHYHYPMPPGHPLWSLPNVIFTPHISGSALSPNYLARTWDIFATNVERWLRHEPLLNQLTPTQLEGG